MGLADSAWQSLKRMEQAKTVHDVQLERRYKLPPLCSPGLPVESELLCNGMTAYVVRMDGKEYRRNIDKRYCVKVRSPHSEEKIAWRTVVNPKVIKEIDKRIKAFEANKKAS